MYACFLFAAIHHLKSSPTFSVRPRSSVGREMVDLIRKSWVRFPPRSKDFFFTSCGSLIPFTRANAQWVIQLALDMRLSVVRQVKEERRATRQREERRLIFQLGTLASGSLNSDFKFLKSRWH